MRIGLLNSNHSHGLERLANPEFEQEQAETAFTPTDH